MSHKKKKNNAGPNMLERDFNFNFNLQKAISVIEKPLFSTEALLIRTRIKITTYIYLPKVHLFGFDKPP